MFAEPPKISTIWVRLPRLAPALCATGVKLTMQEVIRKKLNLHKRKNIVRLRLRLRSGLGSGGSLRVLVPTNDNRARNTVNDQANPSLTQLTSITS